VAIVSITGSLAVLGQLPTIGSSFPLALAHSTARDNGDGTWTVTAQTAEENIPALTNLGASVQTVRTDAEELAKWQTLDTQIDRGPGVA
jgi:hypothetical protein